MKSPLPPTLILVLSCLFVQLQAQPSLVFSDFDPGGPDDISSPVDIANAGDGTDRLFIVQRSGEIRVIDSGTLLTTPFLDISNSITCCGERGLLGLVFHPDYVNNGFFYVNYTDTGGDTNISRFTVDPNNDNLADPNSELIILEIDQPYSNHNAGDLNFGPNDGYLYIALGDGGDGGDPEDRSQNTDCLLGKVLRIDVDGGGNPASPSQAGGLCDFTSTTNYTIPSDNPFVSDPNTLDEIWSIGWRNPWRFSFDPANGDMWLADVGQDLWEEVNYEAAGTGGLNYGWRCYEGNHVYNNSGCGPASDYTMPVFEYDHSLTGGFSITGGYVYRGTAFPNMVGHYIVADYVTENIWTLSPDGNGGFSAISHTVTGIDKISTFGVDEAGEIYAANLDGPLYLVEDISTVPLELGDFYGEYINGINTLTWITFSETNTARFDIEKSNNGRDFTAIGKTDAARFSVEKQTYEFKDGRPLSGNNYYRLKMIDLDGSFSYSPTITIEVNKPFDIALFPNPNNGNFTLQVNGTAPTDLLVEVYNVTGQRMWTGQVDKDQPQPFITLSSTPGGLYWVRVSAGPYVVNRKLVLR